MEVPEKIYLHPDIGGKEFICPWLHKAANLESVEYIRKDVFIENALKWYCLDCECNDNCKADYKCFFRQEYKRYLEGNNNAIPPKFNNAINPDGSVTENYCYRHFIRKVRDAFIEKACKWLKENITNNPNANSVLVRNGCVTLEMLIKDFKNHMTGSNNSDKE
jgi:hypothetical protein